MSTIQTHHLKALKARADYLAHRSVNHGTDGRQSAELRALTWAIDTLATDVDRAQQSAARYRDQMRLLKAQEFDERRDERKAVKHLRRLRNAVVDVASTAILNEVDQFLNTRRKQRNAQYANVSTQDGER